MVWSIFGALFVGDLLTTHDLSAKPIFYAILSMTVIRMVPVAIVRSEPTCEQPLWHSWAGSARAG